MRPRDLRRALPRGLRLGNAIFGGLLVWVMLGSSPSTAAFLQVSQSDASNVLATHRVLEACTRLGVPRLVVASSSSVYGPTDGGASLESDHPKPASPYPVTTPPAEQLRRPVLEAPPLVPSLPALMAEDGPALECR